MTGSSRTVALLLSGGAGTRLWPVSRAGMPKQFLQLFGELSLYQMTLKRLAASGVDDVIISANSDHEMMLSEQAQAIGLQQPTLLLEPDRRDSGPAIAAGVAHIQKKFGNEATICVMPSDHLIPEIDLFSATLHRAVGLAQHGYLTTFGIAPSSPSSEYGYLQRGDAIVDYPGAFKVARFHEKPKPDIAIQYLARGGFDWNSGMFVFTARDFAHEAAILMPDIWEAAQKAVATCTSRGNAISLGRDAFLSAPRISIDYALFERSHKVAMVPAKFIWSDVGNWSSVYDATERNGDGNAEIGQVQTRDVSNSLLVADGTRIIAVDVDDLVIIARPEGVFVARRSRSAIVKDMVGP